MLVFDQLFLYVDALGITRYIFVIFFASFHGQKVECLETQNFQFCLCFNPVQTFIPYSIVQSDL